MVRWFEARKRILHRVVEFDFQEIGFDSVVNRKRMYGPQRMVPKQGISMPICTDCVLCKFVVMVVVMEDFSIFVRCFAP